MTVVNSFVPTVFVFKTVVLKLFNCVRQHSYLTAESGEWMLVNAFDLGVSLEKGVHSDTVCGVLHTSDGSSFDPFTTLNV